MRKSLNKDVQKSNIVCTFNWQQIFRDNENIKGSTDNFEAQTKTIAKPSTTSHVERLLLTSSDHGLGSPGDVWAPTEERPTDVWPSTISLPAPHSPPQDNILNKAGFGRSCLRLDNNNGNFGWRFSLWLDIEPQGDTFVHRVLSSSLAAKSAGLLHSNIWLSTDPFKTAMLCCKVGIVGNLQWLHCWNSLGRKSRQSQTLGGNHVNSKRACYRVIIKDCRL